MEDVHKIECSLIKIGKPTINNRIYKRDNLEAVFENYNNSEIPKVGQFKTDLFSKYFMDLKDITHEIVNVYLNDNGRIEADVKLLDRGIKDKIEENISELPLS